MQAHRLTRRRRARALAAAAATVAVAAPLTQAAWADPAAPPVPAEIVVEDGNKLYLVAHAVGVQIWSCNAVGDAFAWGFVAPRADLLDDRGRLIGTHFGGPTWRARDGSEVVAARDNGVTVDATAIPWLRLKKVRTSVGPDGGRFAETTWIQRINTVGGIAPPAADCNAGSAGTVEEVPYTADYTFWKATPA